MPMVTISPTDKALDAYYARLENLRGGQGVVHERALTTAFAGLLEDAGKARNWTLVQELGQRSATSGKTVIPDGTLRDEWKLPHGYWEAKDSGDDLDTEIRKKRERGYPFDNIIFEDTNSAVLFQDGRETLRTPLRDRDKLARLLTDFFNYEIEPFREFTEAVAYFKGIIPEIAGGLKERLAEAHKDNKAFQAAFAAFMELCRTALNPNISPAAVDEMLIQHMLTERLIRKIFMDAFKERNVIAGEIEKVIAALTSRYFDRAEFLGRLDRFYTAIERAAERVREYSEKQRFINTVYEQFFQGYSVALADTHGIVYTPQEIVDFMCAAVEEVLADEFGAKLGDEGVYVIDPATGTGNFVVNLLRRCAQSNPRGLDWFYREGLFANEVMLMPYYIASLNIEHEYYDLTGKYAPFEGVCFVDTLDLAEGAQMRMAFMTEKNTARVERQKRAPITVIIGNPPYNVGQINENDNNKNRKYEVIDQRVRDTYVKDSSATLRMQLYDPYVKFFRWATDRLQGRDGIVCFVTNNSFVDQIAFDGMRKHLLQDFTQVYHLDLHGNVRQNPKLSGTTHNVFGIQVGVGITVAVRKSPPPNPLSTSAQISPPPNPLSTSAQISPPPNPLSTSAQISPPPNPLSTSAQISPPPNPLPTSQARGEGESTPPLHERSGMERGQGGEDKPRHIPTYTDPKFWERALKPIARQMRHEPTPAEDYLWERLRNRRAGGFKFRRQHPIDRFIVDFYCHEARLVVEVDGEIHQYTQEEDALRQGYLESLGLRVLRFSNADVLRNIEDVLEVIASSPPDPLSTSGQISSPPDPLSPSQARREGEQSGSNISQAFGKGELTPPLHERSGMERGLGGEDKPHLHYHRVPEFWTGAEKLAYLTENVRLKTRQDSLNTVDWQALLPDARHTWLVPEHADEFAAFLPMGSKEAKAAKASKGEEAETLFKLYSLGVNTSRDNWVLDFSPIYLAQKMERFIQNYNYEVFRWLQKEPKPKDIDMFINSDSKYIKWTDRLKEALHNGYSISFDALKIRRAIYRPFTAHYLYFDHLLNQRRYQQHYIFPIQQVEAENKMICLCGNGHDTFYCLMANRIVEYKTANAANGGTQCFPFYVYDEDGGNRRENITDWALGQFRAQYGDETISKWDIFYYVYALLHHPVYRERYADNLKRDLPRIPFVSPPPNPLPTSQARREGELTPPLHERSGMERGQGGEDIFRAFADAGKKLADLHLHYETLPGYKLDWQVKSGGKIDYRVKKMRLVSSPPSPLSTSQAVADAYREGESKAAVGYKVYEALVYNETLTLAGIPAEAFGYRLGNRSALEWVVDQYQVKTDARSGIVSDPNAYSDDEQYIVKLVERVVQVSVETVGIVEGLGGYALHGGFAQR